MNRVVSIGGRLVGPGHPVLVIAEIGANHDQDLATALQLVDAALESGCDAVKFQSFTVENWISKDSDCFPTMPGVADLHAELRKAELSWELYQRISEYCAQQGVLCFSTPSHRVDVDRLVELGAPALKFGSVQVTDLPTLEYAAGTGKPILLSGGASDLSEVLAAVEAVQDAGCAELVLLHCTSLYPSEFSQLNLKVLASLRALLDCPIGYSDHSLDPVVAPVAAVAMGAKVIEKHVTLDRSRPGPDHPFALQPDELKRMVAAIRSTEEALGAGYRRLLPQEAEIARLGRRSLVTTRAIAAGETLLRCDLTIKRPGTGIPPRFLELVIGRVARVDLQADRVLNWEQI